ncbi:MAG: YhfX family PLP-dependent enzyme [Erysipelotrichaceae bacterium]|nr:YhfX family PLP-dependent enzyme [Erysipelotrichaceae bacterium]
MFLEKVQENNKPLVEYAFELQQKGLILPDTYVLDYDAIMENGKYMKDAAAPLGIKLYFMLKQIGRNPEIAKGLMEVGFDGVVAVDFKETLVMMKNGVKLGNIGHLVQVPKAALKEVVKARPEVMTVYSYEKILEINEIAKELDMVQPLLIRVNDTDSALYSGQVGGFLISELEELLNKIETLSNVKVGGLTVFPALLFDGKKNEIVPTDNYKVLQRAMAITEKLGYQDLLINMPSATCTASIPLIKELGGNNGEPGHGLTGTTPLHKVTDQKERVGYVYVSEVSHNYLDKSYCYGGGHYRRGHMEYALVGTSLENAVTTRVEAPTMESIDYHYELEGNFNVGDAVVICARTQVFTTRSHVAIVKGLSTGKPELAGIYDSFGEPVNLKW